MPAWPQSLPYPSVGYSMAPVDGVSRTDMESGAPRSRLRFTSQPTIVTVRWEMDQEQFGVFEAWHHYEIADGSAWFDILLLNGQGYQSVAARFNGPWRSDALDVQHFAVTADLLVLARPLMSEAELSAYL